ncbi:MAG TPA: M28 family peptidase, partial [Gemmatimonadales bacterium]|nr:M28 family peptidase [Gemmatimonadales bacterium]
AAAVTALLAVPAALEGQGPRPRRTGIDSLALRAHTYFLAHDLLEGRGTATRGGELAARYVAAAARQLGLVPADSGGFLLPVPLIEATVDTTRTRLAVRRSAAGAVREVAFLAPRDIVPNGGTAATLVSFRGSPAWVGTATDVLAAPWRLPDLNGRVAVMLGVFGPDRAAADTLRARGVTGVLQVIPGDSLFGLYRRSRGLTRLFTAEPVESSFVPPVPAVLVRGVVARAVLEHNGVLPDLQRPFTLDDRTVEFDIATAARPRVAHTVAAVLPGRHPRLRTEFVAYTAHLDHLGIGESVDGDSIYNGFSDNAAGAAMLLAIAAQLREAGTARSALFVWFTGEERGLLGSDWFVARAPFDLARIVAAINLDAGAPPGRSTTWRIAGGDRSTLGDLASRVAREAGWEVTVSSASPNTDYFPFLRVGVPAVFVVPGPGAFEGMSATESQALRARWDRYHHPGDHWFADYPFAGLVRYAEFALRLGLALDAGDRPRMLF